MIPNQHSTPDSTHDSTAGHSRRRFLLSAAGLATALAAAVAACSSPQEATPTAGTTPTPDPSTNPSAAPGDMTTNPSTAGSSRTLVVYFSRPGENYFNGGRTDLVVGNTEVLANMITDAINCDVHRIEAADPYSDSYDATVARNSSEQDEDARPGIANPLTSIEGYDTVLIGSPIWNVRPPMIVATFAEAHDFTGKTVHPFVTYAVSGLGQAERDYGSWCAGARIGEGLAVRGEGVPDPASSARADARAWLATIGLLTL